LYGFAGTLDILPETAPGIAAGKQHQRKHHEYRRDSFHPSLL
jgi:hypothetical protein